MGDVFIWGLYNRAVVEPYVWNKRRELAEIQRIVAEDVPPVLDYLKTQLPADGFLSGTLGIADISIAVLLRNAAFARYKVDAMRWPRTARFVDRVLGQECLAKLQPFEALMLRTPIPEHRAALAADGAPVSAETMGGAVPRPGVMRLP